MIDEKLTDKYKGDMEHKQTHTHIEKEIAVQTKPVRGRLVKAAEAKERSATAEEFPPALLELRATVRRALLMIEAAIEKYLGRAS